MAKTKKKVLPKKPVKKPTATRQEPAKAAKSDSVKAAKTNGVKADKMAAGKGEKANGVKAAPHGKAKPVPEKAAKKAAKDAPKKAMEEPDEVDTDFLASEEDEEIGKLAAEFTEEEEAEVEVDDDLDDEEAEETLEADAGSEDIVLTDAEGNRYCRVRDCDQISTVDGYCRYHYLLLWKKIQVRKKILTDGKLEYYIVELTSRYPDKFLEMIRKDLRNQKDFLSAIQELEIDESGLENEFEEEDTQSFIDEVRGMGEGSGESVEDEF